MAKKIQNGIERYPISNFKCQISNYVKYKKNLHASIQGTEILRGINLEVKAGEVHAIMGPNGSGKSTLASVLAGREEFEVTEGEVIFKGKNLLDLAPEDRAREGVFLAFQYPVEIPGVSSTNFLRTAVNQVREYRGLEALDAVKFLTLMKEKMKLVEIDQKLLSRSLNEGFPEEKEAKRDIPDGNVGSESVYFG